MQKIFQNKLFDLPSPKIIIVLEGGLNTCSERLNDFNEKQFSAAVARLLLDIGTNDPIDISPSLCPLHLGRNKLSDDQGAPWLFSNLRHVSESFLTAFAHVRSGHF